MAFKFLLRLEISLYLFVEHRIWLDFDVCDSALLFYASLTYLLSLLSLSSFHFLMQNFKFRIVFLKG